MRFCDIIIISTPLIGEDKAIFIHRCPWCGEKLLPPPPFYNQYKNVFLKCPVCKNKYTVYNKRNKGNGTNRTKISAAILLLICFLGIPLRPPFSIVEWSAIPLWGMAICILLLMGILLWILHLPYGRSIPKKEKKLLSDKYKKSVFILWETHQNNGLFYPKLQIPNGEIFPACFTDANEQPISTALCVVLEDIKWADKRQCTCNIHFVSDNAPAEELLCSGNQFYLYHNHRLIAKGKMQ